MNVNILLVDDEEAVVAPLRYHLEKEGYAVVTAYDGEAALALAEAERPDLIVLDLMLPKLDGWEVCRALRQESTVPIIMLTARDEEVSKVYGLELGVDDYDYLSKPFSLRELLARVRELLRRVGYADAGGTRHLRLSPPLARRLRAGASLPARGGAPGPVRNRSLLLHRGRYEAVDRSQ